MINFREQCACVYVKKKRIFETYWNEKKSSLRFIMYTIKDALPDKRKTSVLNILENNLVTKDKCIVQFCIENVSLRRLKIYVLNIFYNTHNNYLPFPYAHNFRQLMLM